jgi:hypothetical protein
MNSANAKREIIGLALLVDEITDLAVFVDYQAHVGNLSISASRSKDNWEDKVFKGDYYVDFRFRRDTESHNRIKKFLTEEIQKATEIKKHLA